MNEQSQNSYFTVEYLENANASDRKIRSMITNDDMKSDEMKADSRDINVAVIAIILMLMQQKRCAQRSMLETTC